MKNLIYLGIILVCLGVAGYVIFSGDSDDSGISSLSNEDQIWVICMECGASYQMGKKDYYEQLAEKSKERMGMPTTIYLTCDKCGKDAVTEAIKCEKCGNVFRKGAIPGDLQDRCPKCKFSKTEAIRKERKKNMAQ